MVSWRRTWLHTNSGEECKFWTNNNSADIAAKLNSEFAKDIAISNGDFSKLLWYCEKNTWGTDAILQDKIIKLLVEGKIVEVNKAFNKVGKTTPIQKEDFIKVVFKTCCQ